MATIAKAKLPSSAWLELNPATDLPRGCAAKYDAYKAEYAKMKTVRQAFEEAMIAEARKHKSLEADQTLRFGYNFGKLSVAVVDVAEVAPKAAKAQDGRKLFGAGK